MYLLNLHQKKAHRLQRKKAVVTDKRVTRSQDRTSRSKSPKKAKKESSPKKKKVTEKKTSKSPAKRGASKSKSPKKTTKPKKKVKPLYKVSRTTKPTYNIMIAKAIHELGEVRNGSSAIAIGKYIQKTYPVPKDFNRHLRLALHKAESIGYLSRNKNSYRLSEKGGRKLLSKRDREKIAVKKPIKRVVKKSTKVTMERREKKRKEGEEGKERKKRKKCISKEI